MPPLPSNEFAARCANGVGLGDRRVGGSGMQRGQSTLEWVIGAAVILGTLVVRIIAWNQGLVTKIGSMEHDLEQRARLGGALLPHGNDPDPARIAFYYSRS